MNATRAPKTWMVSALLLALTAWTAPIYGQC